MRFNPRAVRVLALAIWFCAAAAPAAQPGDLPRKHHAWGRFPPGAWKIVEVTSETLDEQGRVAGVSSSEITSTLTRLDEERFTLRIESVMEVAGKRIVAEPQTVTQRYSGLALDQQAERTALPAELVLIDGRRYECNVEDLVTRGTNTRSTTRTWLSASMAPYVLRRESTTTDLDSQQTTGRTTLEVIALDMPFKALDRVFNTAHLKSMQQHDKGSTVTLAITTVEVPGGVVAHTAKELDAEGRVVRRNTLELIDYGVRETEDAAPLRRPRARRRRRVSETTTPSRSRMVDTRPGAAVPATGDEG